MKKQFILFYFIMGVSLNVYTQSLRIGDKCPDLLLNKVLNYKTDHITLSQFKADLIVFDFWSHICVACIHSFPEIDSLQTRFGKRVQFIAVNRESYDSTVQFFSKRKSIKLPAIPFVTGDTVLSALFPKTFVPWHVWLDKNLVVRYISFGYNTTAQNIQAFLGQKKLSIYQLVDLKQKNETGINDDRSYYAYITPCVPGTDRQNVYGENKQGKLYLSEECSSIPELIKTAFGKKFNIRFNWNDSVILEVSDRSRYVYDPGRKNKDEWMSRNFYNYYLMLPEEKRSQLYDYMLQDIERYFNVSVSWERRKVFHHVLVRVDSLDRLKTGGGRTEDRLKIATLKLPVDDSLRYMTNCPFQQFVKKMKTWMEGLFKYPFKDETGYAGNIDIALNAAALDSHDLLQIRKELQRYGLDIVTELREKDVLVIREN